jgi:uncharacterized protein
MLLDTSGSLCFLNQEEPLHERAVALVTAAPRKMLIHNYVLAELVALALVRGFSRAIVLPYMLELINNSKVQVIWVDKSLHQEAMSLLLERQDKTYSLCDAVSFIVLIIMLS